MAALHTLLRLYEPDNELAALGRPKENYCTTTQNARRGRRRSTARAPPTIRGPGVAGVEALPGRLSAVSGGCGRPSAVED